VSRTRCGIFMPLRRAGTVTHSIAVLWRKRHRGPQVTGRGFPLPAFRRYRPEVSSRLGTKPKMDQQTKVGIGAAAGIALMALLEPHLFESHPAMTALIYAVLVIVMLWGFGPAFLVAIRKLQGGFKRMWPQYLMTLAAVLFFVGLIGFLQLNVAPQKQKENTESLPSTPTKSASSPMAPGILLDAAFELLPRISPPDGIIHIFEISEEHAGIQASLIEHQFDPSATIDWRRRFPEWPIFGISKCEITSTTNESVFYAVVPINLIFRNDPR
jgi:hypothetical protein